ncbi:MAG: transcriptional regulator [Cyclobacteriaceae bacterium]|nr:transcriptional regulator [Cyclobacteriaceae bacterium]
MWTIIQTKREYSRVLERIEELSVNPPSPKSEEGKELMLLGFLAAEYEEANFPIEYPDPIDAIKVRMDDLGLTVNDLLSIFGDKGTASKVLNRQRALSLSMIRGLSRKLALPAELLIKPIQSGYKSTGVAMVHEAEEKYGAKKKRK